MVRHQVAGDLSQPRISPYNRSVMPDTSATSGRTIPVPEVRMVHPWRRMRYNTSTARLRAEDSQEMLHRAAGNVRFMIFSRQRSASTTFVGLLNLHPNITCRCIRSSLFSMACETIASVTFFRAKAAYISWSDSPEFCSVGTTNVLGGAASVNVESARGMRSSGGRASRTHSPLRRCERISDSRIGSSAAADSSHQ